MSVLGWMCVLHFVADGPFQSRYMGENKSSNLYVLCHHLSIIYITMTFGLLFLVPMKIALTVGALNAFVHGLIDGTLWNLYKVITRFRLVGIGNLTHQEKQEIIKGFKYWKDKLFYDTIMFDQLCHYLTLVLLAKAFGI